MPSKRLCVLAWGPDAKLNAYNVFDNKCKKNVIIYNFFDYFHYFCKVKPTKTIITKKPYYEKINTPTRDAAHGNDNVGKLLHGDELRQHVHHHP